VIGFEAWSGFLGERRACVKLSRRGEEAKKCGGKNCYFFLHYGNMLVSLPGSLC
jgi:hypothetical protein